MVLVPPSAPVAAALYAPPPGYPGGAPAPGGGSVWVDASGGQVTNHHY